MDSKVLVQIIAIAAMAMGAPLAMGSESGIEKRWLVFRDHLPEDVRENIDRNFREMDFELLAQVRKIEEQSWCDNISVYVPHSKEADLKWRQFWASFGNNISQLERDKLREDAAGLMAPTNLRAKVMEQELMQKCRYIAQQHPHLARIVSRK